MNPRRWKLRESNWGSPYANGPKLTYGEKVPVREDTITEEDIEAVAVREAVWDGQVFAVMRPGRQEEYRKKAREILSLVLGSGKEDKDA
jgi:hypothetical protein